MLKCPSPNTVSIGARSHHERLPGTTARDRLLEGAGKQFDPELVDIFIFMLARELLKAE